jgi:hypothetical protein
MINDKPITYSYCNWGPFVMKTTIDNYIIEKLIDEGKKKYKNVSNTLAGQLKHQYSFPDEIINWFYNETTHLFSAYREAHSVFHNQKSLKVELKSDDLWINFMEPGEFNPPHIHTGDISFVVFCDVPYDLEKEAAEFVGTATKPGQLVLDYGESSSFNWTTHQYLFTPQTGDMFIFPALLKHWVSPFKSNVKRISVSGNLTIANRNSFPFGNF